MAAWEIPRISAPLREPLEFGRFPVVRHPLNDGGGGHEQRWGSASESAKMEPLTLGVEPRDPARSRSPPYCTDKTSDGSDVGSPKIC